MLLKDSKPNNYGTNLISIDIYKRHRSTKVEPNAFFNLLLTIYVVSSLLIVACFIFARIHHQYEGISMIVIISSFLIASIGSFIAMVKFVTTNDRIQTLKENNYIYTKKQDQLSESLNILKDDVNESKFDINRLNEQSDKLKEDQKEFNDLTKELEEIAHIGQDVMEVVDYLNGSLHRMNNLIKENHKTYLLEQYYDTLKQEIFDGNMTMNKTNYEKRFLYRITKRWRTQFQRLGSFEEIWGKKEINVEEFIVIVHKILDQNKDLIHLEFDRQFSIHLTSRSVEISQELEEKESYSLKAMKGVRFAEDGIDVAILRKEIQLSLEFDGVNEMFVDLIDDRHNDEISEHIMEFSKMRISLKSQSSIRLSLAKDDSFVENLREELLRLSTKSTSDFIYIGEYGTQAD